MHVCSINHKLINKNIRHWWIIKYNWKWYQWVAQEKLLNCSLSPWTLWCHNDHYLLSNYSLAINTTDSSWYVSTLELYHYLNAVIGNDHMVFFSLSTDSQSWYTWYILPDISLIFYLIYLIYFRSYYVKQIVSQLEFTLGEQISKVIDLGQTSDPLLWPLIGLLCGGWDSGERKENGEQL